MKKGYTDITIILDRSGSMTSIFDATIEGFNAFLEGQKKDTSGECKISLVQFDTVYEKVYSGKDVKDAPALSAENFQPRGGTALLDAMGKTINDIGSRLTALGESERPEKVMVVVITDGEENSSREFGREKIFEMVKHQAEKYGWDFSYIGANQDAITVGATMGFAASKSMSYNANASATRAVFAATTAYVSSARMGANASFSDEDRIRAKAS